MESRMLKCTTAVTLFAALMIAVGLRAQEQPPSSPIFNNLFDFQNSNGNGFLPRGTLVQGADGKFYGTTVAGGTNNNGTIFKITLQGALTTLYRFNGTDGSEPENALVLAKDGNFYGTTFLGGVSGNGTVYKMTPGGTLTALYSFCQASCADGSRPNGLIQATDGNFYGTTNLGANDVCPSGCGTVFKITPGGTLTTLHSFDVTDGFNPSAGLVQGSDGSLYGTTIAGGSNNACAGGCGTVFKITLGGVLTTVHNFAGPPTEGSLSEAALIQGTDGNFYGTTAAGGSTTFCFYGCGTVFKMTPEGTLATLHEFDFTDGWNPTASLVQANGNFYGTTLLGGTTTGNCNTTGCGTVFKMAPTGALTTLHSFDFTDGNDIFAGLLQATNGIFYGTAYDGEAYDQGTVFSLSVGLAPFVETVPASGRIGTKVIILGTNLTGATSVTFNGTPAVFKVISPSEIGTTVPTGATTGPVQVVTPSGTLTSNVPFRVRP